MEFLRLLKDKVRKGYRPFFASICASVSGANTVEVPSVLEYELAALLYCTCR